MSIEQRIERHDALYTLINLLPGESFGEHPACADEDPELFFPAPGETARIAAAKAVCSRCPLVQECLRVALRRGEHGVWGGMTEDERAELRRAGHRAQRLAAPVVAAADGDEVAAAVERALVEVERASGAPAPGLRRRVAAELAAASRRGEDDEQRADAALRVLRPVLSGLGAGPGAGVAA